MTSGFFIGSALRNRRFIDSKSIFLQDADGGKVTAGADIKAISDSLDINVKRI